jgi:hypothetical protein
MARTDVNFIPVEAGLFTIELPAHRRSLLPIVGAACLVTSVNFGA